MHTSILVLALGCVAAGAIQNPSFDNGLTGWQTAGQVQSGSGFARLSAYSGAAPVADLLTFAPEIDGIIPHEVLAGEHWALQFFSGSAIQQSVTLAEDSTLSVDLQQYRNTSLGGMVFFSISIAGESYIASELPTWFSDQQFYNPLTVSLQVPAGTHDLLIAAFGNQPSSAVDSWLDAIDVRISPHQAAGVPDGGLTAGLLTLGLLGIRLIRR